MVSLPTINPRKDSLLSYTILIQDHSQLIFWETLWERPRFGYHPRNPQSPEIHVVVIPKNHVSSILDPRALDGALLSSRILAVQKTAREMGLDKKGILLYENSKCIPKIRFSLAGSSHGNGGSLDYLRGQ
jgi:hypothetical protein